MTNYYYIVVELYLKDEGRVKASKFMSVELTDNIYTLEGDKSLSFTKEMDNMFIDIKNSLVQEYKHKNPDSEVNNSIIISINKL